MSHSVDGLWVYLVVSIWVLLPQRMIRESMFIHDNDKHMIPLFYRPFVRIGLKTDEGGMHLYIFHHL